MRIKRIFKIVGITIGLIVISLLAFFYYMFSGLCGNTIISNTTSPDNKWSIVLFERNCGATTSFSSQISIIEYGDELENESGNVFIAKGYPEGYAINWVSGSLVRVSGAKGEVYKMRGDVNGVSFSYE